MGYKLFCDHCGLDVDRDSLFIIKIHGHKHTTYDDDDDEDVDEEPRKNPRIKVDLPRLKLDLCHHCVPKWVARVEKLTKASDP